jgi:hypothetical protein
MGGGMMGGFGVDPDALAETAKGISDAINGLKSLGIDESAEVGRGFSNLALTGEQAGHPDAQSGLEEFCQRWSWGVRTLVQDGNQFAAMLHLSAGAYHDMEDYALGTLKDIAVDLGGDPHAQDEQVEKQSWGQIARSDIPDYSAKSFDQAGHEIAGQWKAEGRDMFEGQYGMNKEIADAAGVGQQFSQAEDAIFGPAPQQDGS